MLEIKTEAVEDTEYQKNSARVLDSIKKLLESNGIKYEIMHHVPAGAGKDVAEIRGMDLANGGKSMLVTVDGVTSLFVLSGARKLCTKKIKSRFSAKKVSFANGEELKALTGLVPGCIPPFGEPILPVKIYLDPSIEKNEIISFNAGTLTDSISMAVSDYLKVIDCEIFDFSNPSG